jgi:uncharacterized repeat protein (TIGR03803 family)
MDKLVCGKLFWAACALCLATGTSVLAQVQFTTLADFNGSNGQGSLGSLVQGLDGNLYGTSQAGGANGVGTVFKVTPTGALTTLYSFCSQAGCADGEVPTAALVLGTDGNFYGTASRGGANNGGTVFKITPTGMLTTLYSFCAETSCLDGLNPMGALVEGADGDFYGATAYGGANNAGDCLGPGVGCGTIFKITAAGTLTTLYSFTGGADGTNPQGALVQVADRDFYGTATCNLYCGGSVFKITSKGVFTILYAFLTGPTGLSPAGFNPLPGLSESSKGNFYGTTHIEGDFGFGTVFAVTPWGTLSTLYMFTGASDGGYPLQLIEGSDGNFYGTTQEGGYFSDQCPDYIGSQCGTVFKITPQGRLTTLHRFCAQLDCPDGDYPQAGLLQATDGQFYGTTLVGGSRIACSYGCGTVFSLSVGLGPFLETLPTSGSAGKLVRVLGTNLTGASSVTFNGTPATFTVESSSYIETTVPASATTGTVQVVTPSGTLSSNVPFRVTP